MFKLLACSVPPKRNALRLSFILAPAQTLDVLRAAKACGVYTKSSIMLGLGETDDEVIDTMLDLKVCGGGWGGLTRGTPSEGLGQRERDPEERDPPGRDRH